MKTIALMNFKGGTGKTLLSIQLAIAFYEMGIKTAILDMNPGYGTGGTFTLKWIMERGKGPMVMHDPDAPWHLRKELESRGVEFVIMDVPGRVQMANYYATHEADLIIIPTEDPLDYVQDTLSLTQYCDKKAYVLMNRINKTWKRSNRKAIDQLGAMSVPIIPITVHRSAEYNAALIDHLGITEYNPISKAAQEISLLRSWLIKKLKLSWQHETMPIKLERICPLESRVNL